MGRVVVGLGDSISYGMGDTGRNWIGPSWVGRFGHTIAAARTVNLSTPGQRTADLVRVQLDAALQVGADVALVSIGGNDLLRTSFDVRRIFSTVKATVGALTGSGMRVAVLGLPQPPNHARLPLWLRGVIDERAQWANDAIANGIRAAAPSGHALFVDLVTDHYVRSREYWHIDCMHPSPSGHEHLAERVRVWLGYPSVRAPLPTVGEAGGGSHVPGREWMLREGLPWSARRSIDVIPQMAISLAGHRWTRSRRWADVVQVQALGREGHAAPHVRTAFGNDVPPPLCSATPERSASLP